MNRKFRKKKSHLQNSMTFIKYSPFTISKPIRDHGKPYSLSTHQKKNVKESIFQGNKME